MRCADINSIFGKIIFSIILAVFSFYSVYKNGNYRLRYVLLAMGTAYMAFSSTRSLSLFIICGVIPLSFYFKNLELPEFKNKKDKKTLFIRIILIILILFVIIIGSFKILKDRSTTISANQEIAECVNYLDNLEKLDIDNMRIYTGYNDGGYLEYRGYKVYLDPRAEVFLKSNNDKYDIFKEYYQLQKGKLYYKDVLNKYNFTYLLVADNDILYEYLDYDENYKLIYSSNSYKIYENKSN
jgi:hypothetical protein